MNEKTLRVHMDHIPFKAGGRAVALGFFDGIHEGHEEIIKRMVKTARMNGLTSCVQTFTGFSKEGGKCLTTIDERLDILTGLGVDEMLVIDFSEKFKSTPAEQFFTDVLRFRLNARALFAGDDYRFGAGAAGDAELLKKLGVEASMRVDIVRAKLQDGRRISSTWMKEALAEGDAETIRKLCGGRAFGYEGKVTEGKRLGRTLGFPTANLPIPSVKTVARRGVYVSRVLIGKKVYYGVTNIGLRPTVEDADRDIAETYIFGLDEDIYGARIRVELLSFLRPEKNFESAEKLREAVEYNKVQAMEYLRKSGIID